MNSTDKILVEQGIIDYKVMEELQKIVTEDPSLDYKYSHITEDGDEVWEIIDEATGFVQWTQSFTPSPLHIEENKELYNILKG